MPDSADLQTIKAIFAAFGRGDLPAVLAQVSPAVEWTLGGPADLGYGGTYHGREGASRFFARLAALVELTAFEPELFVDQAPHVVVAGFEKGKYRDSGRAFTHRWVIVFTLEAGQVTRFHEYVYRPDDRSA